MINFINEWKDKIASYLNANVSLVKLNFLEHISKIFGYFIFTLIGCFLGFAIIIYLGFAMAECFTVFANGSRTAGFFMTVGFYLLMGGTVYVFRKPIIKSFTNQMIKHLTQDDHKEK